MKNNSTMEIDIKIWRKKSILLETKFEIKNEEHFQTLKRNINYDMGRAGTDTHPFIIDADSENSFIIDSRLLKKSIVTIQLIK